MNDVTRHTECAHRVGDERPTIHDPTDGTVVKRVMTAQRPGIPRLRNLICQASYHSVPKVRETRKPRLHYNSLINKRRYKIGNPVDEVRQYIIKSFPHSEA